MADVDGARQIDDGDAQHRRADAGGTDEVGVGPWQGACPSTPDGSLDPRYDPELLEHGDRRNVEDRFRYWRHDAIVEELDGEVLMSFDTPFGPEATIRGPEGETFNVIAFSPEAENGRDAE